MSDEFDPNITTSSLNNLVDERIKSADVRDEEYTKGDEGNKIAIKHRPLADTEATTARSWVLAEIERTVASDVLPFGRQKIAQFGNTLSRRNDFRLRDLVTRLDRQNRMEFPETPSVDQPEAKSRTLQSIRDFDIRAHSFRQISTNATLASYQFQRTAVLPYMRKSLAFDFQKTSLLKKVVGAIGSMEKSVLTKLEAIKMNTGAAAPTKVTLFTRLKNAIRDKQIDRVAGNIAGRIMERNAKIWDKTVAPIVTKLNKVLLTPGPNGGVNGAGRKITSKLNRIRHSLNRKANAPIDPDNPIAGDSKVLSRVGSTVLGGAVSIGQRFNLSPGWNKLVSGPVSNATTLFDDLNPFTNRQADKSDFDDLEKAFNKGPTNAASLPQISSLIKFLQDWRTESVNGQKQLLDHVSTIRDRMMSIAMVDQSVQSPVRKIPATQVIAPQDTAPQAAPPVKIVPKAKRKLWSFGRKNDPVTKPVPLSINTKSISSGQQTSSTSSPSVPMPGIGTGRMTGLMKRFSKAAFGKVARFDLHRQQRGKSDNQFGRRMLSKLGVGITIKRTSGKNDAVTTKPSILDKIKGGLVTGSRLAGTAGVAALASVGALTRRGIAPNPSAVTNPLGPLPAMPRTTSDLTPSLPPVDTGASQLQSGQAAQTTLLGQLTQQLSNINETIASGNAARAVYEDLQKKRQKLADAAAEKLKVRKNSYEDMQAQRQARKGVSPQDQMKSTADEVAARVKSGTDKAEGAAAAEEDKPSLWDTFSDLLGGDDDKDDAEDDDASDEESDKKKKKKGKGRKSKLRRGRPGARRRLARMQASRGSKSLFKNLMRTGGNVAKGGLKLSAKGAWGLTKAAAGSAPGVAKFGLKTALGAGKLGFAGALGATKLGGKGLVGALKLGGKGALAIGGTGVVGNLVKGGLAGTAASLAGAALENSDAPDSVKRLGSTLSTMASYGSMGATLGSIVPGLGTVAGGAIGAAVGAIVANADKASAALSVMSSGALGATRGLWTTIFGQDAKIDATGKVVQQEKSSLVGDLKTFFMGRQAKYTADGQMLVSGRDSLLGNIKYGFEKTLFGDRFSNGEFKEGTSLLAEARDGLKSAITSFGNQLMNLPQDMAKTFKKGALYKGGVALKDGAVWAGGKIKDGAIGTKRFLTNPGKANLPLTISAAVAAGKAWQDFSWKDTKNAITSVDSNTLVKLSTYLTPTGFITGVSNAILGWWNDTKQYDDPATPQYKYVDLVLNAYGIKNRALFKFVHSLETSQDKINKNQTKPFDDSDMAYQAGRFGFDSKNQDAVNYFKQWYKRRFLPAMVVIDKALKSRHLTFDTVLGAEDKDVLALNDILKKEIAGSGILQIGLEPSVMAYNRYAKIGTKDPGGLTPAALNKDKPFDPRDPNNRATQSTVQSGGYNQSSGSTEFSTSDYTNSAIAARKKAAMKNGKVSDQPEFQAAFQKLPPNIKAIVKKSRPLQFVLWSTAIQHGPNGAALIFERDYSDQLDEKALIRTIYQDRSRQFGALNESDRSEAVSHLGEEQRFALGLNNNSVLNRGQMQSMVSNVYDPAGNYSTGQAPKGSVGERAKQAMQHFMQKGYSKVAAAGVVGNLMAESKLVTNAVGDSGKALGIAQWHADRRAKIAQRFGKTVQAMSLMEQLDAVDWEMRSGSGVTGGKDLPGDLNRASNAGQAAVMVMNRYERPADRVRGARERGGAAMSLMGMDLGNMAQNPTTGAVKPKQQTPSVPSEKSGTNPKSQAVPAKAAQPKTSTPKPTPEKHDMSQWNPVVAAMNNHADALRSHTDFSKQSSAASKTPATIPVPVLLGAPGKNNGGNPWLSTSMKKSMVVTGR